MSSRVVFFCLLVTVCRLALPLLRRLAGWHTAGRFLAYFWAWTFSGSIIVHCPKLIPGKENGITYSVLDLAMGGGPACSRRHTLASSLGASVIPSQARRSLREKRLPVWKALDSLTSYASATLTQKQLSLSICSLVFLLMHTSADYEHHCGDSYLNRI